MANQGLSLATGEYLAVIEDDTLLFADHFERLVSALEQNKEASIGYAMHMEIETEEAPAKKFSYFEENIIRPETQPFAKARLWTEECIPLSTAIFHRGTYERHGGLDTDLESAAGWDLLTRYSLTEEFEFVDRATMIMRTPADKEWRKSLEAQRAIDTEKAKAKQSGYKLNVTPADVLAMHSELRR